MTRAAALAGLLLLAACNRNQDTLAPDADAETRNATAAKTLADIQAAEDAARTPLAARPAPARQIERPAISETVPEVSNTSDDPVSPPQ